MVLEVLVLIETMGHIFVCYYNLQAEFFHLVFGLVEPVLCFEAHIDLNMIEDKVFCDHQGSLFGTSFDHMVI